MTNNALISKGNLTRQRILDFLIFYCHAHGRAPSIREIMDAVGIQSTSVIPYHLRRLERDGFIELVPGITRGIIVTDKSTLQQYHVVYMCHYPGGCDFQSDSPGDCQIHSVPLIPNVWRVSNLAPDWVVE